MRLFPILAAATLLAAPAFAARAVKPNGATPAVPKNGVRAELLRELDAIEKKTMQLAMAMPASKYSWRPARGVRSVSEVFMHVAGGNYFTAAATSGKPVASEAEGLEQIVEKERVLQVLRESFELLRNAMLSTPDTELDRTVRMFGSDMSERAAFMTAINHMHEHLGQQIAYARMNGIAPPWSGM
jgi:uncharacterized damage-inducible protein DinB